MVLVLELLLRYGVLSMENGDGQIIEIDEDGNVHGDISGLKPKKREEPAIPAVKHKYLSNGASRDPCCSICGGEMEETVHHIPALAKEIATRLGFCDGDVTQTILATLEEFGVRALLSASPAPREETAAGRLREARSTASMLDELVHLAIAVEGAYDRERTAAATELDLVRLVLSSYQTAYAKFHCDEGRGVIDSDQMAIGYASVELAKALRGEQSGTPTQPTAEKESKS